MWCGRKTTQQQNKNFVLLFLSPWKQRKVMKFKDWERWHCITQTCLASFHQMWKFVVIAEVKLFKVMYLWSCFLFYVSNLTLISFILWFKSTHGFDEILEDRHERILSLVLFFNISPSEACWIPWLQFGSGNKMILVLIQYNSSINLTIYCI